MNIVLNILCIFLFNGKKPLFQLSVRLTSKCCCVTGPANATFSKHLISRVSSSMSMKSNKLKRHLTHSRISPWTDQASLVLLQSCSGMITLIKT